MGMTGLSPTHLGPDGIVGGRSSGVLTPVRTGALVGRMNFGLALASNKVRGVVVSNAAPDGIALGAPTFQRR